MDPKQVQDLAKQIPLDLRVREESCVVQCSAFQIQHGVSGLLSSALELCSMVLPLGFTARATWLTESEDVAV